MLRFTTSVTQKGQVTLPKQLREQSGLLPFTPIFISVDETGTGLRIEPTQDITHLAGKFVPGQAKPVMQAREVMEKNYQRS